MLLLFSFLISCRLQGGVFTVPSKWKIYGYYLKIFFFVTIWLTFTTILLLKKEFVPDLNIITVPPNLTKGQNNIANFIYLFLFVCKFLFFKFVDYVIGTNVYEKPIKLELNGPFDRITNKWVKVWVEMILFDEKTLKILTKKVCQN